MREFLALLKSIGPGNAQTVLAQIPRVAADWAPDAVQARTMARHLEAVSFRLSGSGEPELAACACEIAADLNPLDSDRLTLAAAEIRVRALCDGHRFYGVESAIARLRRADAEQIRLELVTALIELGWNAELRGAIERSVTWYAHALALATGPSPTSPDGDPLGTKIRNLRRLQLEALARDGRFGEAVQLHEATRHLTGTGALTSHTIVSVKQLSEVGGATYIELRPQRPIAPPCLKFIGPSPELESEPGDLIALPFYFALVTDCRAFPRSNLVTRGGYLAYDLAAHPRRPDIVLQDGVNSDQFVTAIFGTAGALVEAPVDIVRFDSGLCLFGLQSRNYGHWLLEYVPRLLAYNDPRCPGGMPLCVDEGMPDTHEELISFLDVRRRPIIRLPQKAVEFGVLGLAPVPAFFPFEMRPGTTVYDTVWPADLLMDVRRLILERAQALGALSGAGGRRLFISRKAFAQRQLVNEVEIADALRLHGFEVIAPETMTFLEQIAAFHAADVIVGSSSSALVNGLFCRPNCQILGLIHSNRAFNFRGYTSCIEAGGAKITFLRGQTVAEAEHAFHANYRVEPADVLAALAQLLPPTSRRGPYRRTRSAGI